MKQDSHTRHLSFYALGLSYQKADAGVRGQFSLGDAAMDALTAEARSNGIGSLMAISTCNRTELYGFAQHPYQLIRLLCAHTSGTVETFQEVAYIHKNHEAIEHLFRVGTGLDSQILGDFEIISQVKQSFNRAKREGMTDPFLERLCNSVIQASKRIKNETELSTGTTSVAFASVRYLLDTIPDIASKKIALYGTGKIGRNTCKNLVKHSGNRHLTLINRTPEHAQGLAERFHLQVKGMESLDDEIASSDILIVATGAPQPTVTREHVQGKGPLLILDLSIPNNVDPAVAEIEGVDRVHLDTLSKMTDDTLAQRRAQIPKAEAIVTEVREEFGAWLETRKFAPVISALKDKLDKMKAEELDFQSRKNADFDTDQAQRVADRLMQKITKHFANHMKRPDVDADDSAAFIRDVFQLPLDER